MNNDCDSSPSLAPAPSLSENQEQLQLPQHASQSGLIAQETAIVSESDARTDDMPALQSVSDSDSDIDPAELETFSNDEIPGPEPVSSITNTMTEAEATNVPGPSLNSRRRARVEDDDDDGRDPSDAFHQRQVRQDTPPTTDQPQPAPQTTSAGTHNSSMRGFAVALDLNNFNGNIAQHIATTDDTRQSHQPQPQPSQDDPPGTNQNGNSNPLGPFMAIDRHNFRQFINAFSNVFTINGGFPRREAQDPERAKKLVDGLELVPIGLVRRLERVGGNVGGGTEGLETGATGGDVGCAICWDRLLDGDGEGWTFSGQRQDRTSSENRTPIDSADALLEDQNPDIAKSTSPRIVSLPCAHVFHATCLIPWFSRPRQTTCPTCRFNIDPDNLTYSEGVTQNNINPDSGIPPVAPAQEEQNNPAPADHGHQRATMVILSDGRPPQIIPLRARPTGGPTNAPPDIQSDNAQAADAAATTLRSQFQTPDIGSVPPMPPAQRHVPTREAGIRRPRSQPELREPGRQDEISLSMAQVREALSRQLGIDGNVGGFDFDITFGRLVPGNGNMSGAEREEQIPTAPASENGGDENTIPMPVDDSTNPTAVGEDIVMAEPDHNTQNSTSNLDSTPTPTPPNDNGDDIEGFVTFGVDVVFGGPNMHRPDADPNGDSLAAREHQTQPDAPASEAPNNASPNINRETNANPNRPPLEVLEGIRESLNRMTGVIHETQQSMDQAMGALFSMVDSPVSPTTGPISDAAQQQGPPPRMQDFFSAMFGLTRTNEQANVSADDGIGEAGVGGSVPTEEGESGALSSAETVSSAAPIPPVGSPDLRENTDVNTSPNTTNPNPRPNSFQEFIVNAIDAAIRSSGTAGDANGPPTPPGTSGTPADPNPSPEANVDANPPSPFTGLQDVLTNIVGAAVRGAVTTNFMGTGAGAGAGVVPPGQASHLSQQAPRTWTLPSPPGPTLRQRVERKEREAGLRCHGMFCGVGPSDEDPYVGLSEEAKKQVSIVIKNPKVDFDDRMDIDGKNEEEEMVNVCPHTFHAPCLVSSARLSTMGVESMVSGSYVEVTCSVCRGVGGVKKVDWDKGVLALA